VRYRKLKKKSLAVSISCALAFGCATQFSSISCAAETGASVTVDEDTVKETTADPSGNIINDYEETTYTDVTIKEGGRWRPMDAIGIKDLYGSYKSNIKIDTLSVASGGMIDVTWQETPNWTKLSNQNYFRSFAAKDVTLADGVVFRIGAATGQNQNSNRIDLGTFDNRVAGEGTLYVQLGNIIGFDPLKINRDPNTFGSAIILGINEKKVGQFKVEGQASFLDAPLYVYKVTPIIKTEEHRNFTYDPQTGEEIPSDDNPLLYAQLVDYTFDNTRLLSESAKTAGDMQLAMRNLWRVENTNFFHRIDELHAPGKKNREGIWANTYNGKFTNRGSYGRSVSENYHGQQVGYDKVRVGDFYNGKLYTGLFFQQTKADVGIHTGSGNSESKGFGTYATWVGNNGRYVDLALRGSKLTNDYHFYNNGGKIDGNNSAWGFGMNARYGIHKSLINGWFWEPQVGMAMGKIDDASYTTSNGLQVSQDKVNVFTGQLGVLVGKTLGEKNGNIYAKATVYHDFLDGGSMRGSYSDGTQAIETGANKDTWWELALGANTKISPTGNFNLNVLQTFGGDSKNKWQVNGGVDWRWNGFGGGKKAQEHPAVLEEAIPVPYSHEDRENDGQATPVAAAEKAMLQETDGKDNIANGGQSVAPGAEKAPRIPGRKELQSSGTDLAARAVASSVSRQTADHEDGISYELEPVVVEAPRPAWEDKLSPGTVTVIEPDKYKGEQKTLPDLLKEVPGVHVRHVSGLGQYTTVSVRGSTAAQVGVFVDGVLTNLGGDAAVDLSTIPVKNVARIEVYRGYVPARFGGTYMGGVINIVTKKPEKADVSASYGQRSWGGYTGSLQLDAPLGNGTLMVGLNRDQSDGDFRYKNLNFQQNITRDLTEAKQTLANYDQGIKDGWMTPENSIYLDQKKKIAYLEGLSDTRYRMNNRYKNTDVLLKWQDEHWMAKASWKQIDRLMPNAIKGDSFYIDIPEADILFPPGPSSVNHNLRKEQKIDAADVLIGRRDAKGNLEWGWNVNYLDQEKQYNNPEISKSSYISGKPLSVWSNYHSKRPGVALDGTFKAGNHMLDFLMNLSRETLNIRGWKMDSVEEAYRYRWKNKYVQTLFNVQLQDTITLNDAGDLWFTPSVRYNSSDIIGSSLYKSNNFGWINEDTGQKVGKTTWQFAFKKKVDDKLTLRSSYGSYYRLLNLYEIAGDGASILPRPKKSDGGIWDLEYASPEDGIQWDMGANWKGQCLNANADISLTYFSRRSNNLVQLMRYGLDYFSYDNSARGRVNGVELQSNFNWAKWDLNLNATHVNATRTIANLNLGSNDWTSFPMTYTPEWEGRLRLTYRPNAKAALFTEINYTGEQYTADYSNFGAKDMQTALTAVGIGCRYKMNKNSQLVFGVNDLFDKGTDVRHRLNYTTAGGYNEYMLDYPLQGRTYYATLQYDL
jgi:outer membrane autotransporter protein